MPSSIRRIARGLATLAVAGFFSTPLWAQVSVTLPADSTNAAVVFNGPWEPADFESRFAVPPAMQFQVLGDPTADASIRMEASLSQSGRYNVEVAWPEEANASGVRVRVIGGTPSIDQTLTLVPERANAWYSLGKVEFTAGATARFDVSLAPGATVASEARPFAAALSAVRIVPALDEANPFGAPATGREGAESSGATPASASPFASTPGTAAPDPFASPAQAQSIAQQPASPFDAIDRPAGTPASPFAAPETAAGRVASPFDTPDSPFDSPAGRQQAGIGGAFGAPPAGEGSAPAGTNPFADSGSSDGLGAMFSAPGGGAGSPSPRRTSITDTVFSPSDFDEAERPDLGFNFAREGVRGPRATTALFADYGIEEPREAAPSVVLGPEIPWVETFDAARESARELGRPILLLFMSDNASSNIFEQSVLSDDRVAQAMGVFVPVRISIDEAQDLARSYQVASAPYAVVLNPHGFTRGHIAASGDTGRFLQSLKEQAR